MSVQSQLNVSRTFNSSGIGDQSRLGSGTSEFLILSENGLFFANLFGSALPSMVKSIVTNATEVTKVSVCANDNGWAWLIIGRKLYIWRHSASSESKQTRVSCRELTLPSSELLHHARLVAVLVTPSSSTYSTSSVPSCVAVSPEGNITFWPNITNESATISINADLPGQECENLTSLWPTGCLLSTTSGAVVFIKRVLTAGNKPSLICVNLALNKGWFDGISRRVNSFFTTPAVASSDLKRVKVVVPKMKRSSERLFILLGQTLQKWQITEDVQQNIEELHLDDTVKNLLYQNVWKGDGTLDSREVLRAIQIVLLDVACLPDKNVVLFIAAKNNNFVEGESSECHAIVAIDSDHLNRPARHSIVILDCNLPFPKSDESTYCWKLFATPTYFFMVSADQILIAANGDSMVDVVDAATLGGLFLGCGLINESQMIAFSTRHGFLGFHPAPTADQLTFIGGGGGDAPFSEVRVPEHLSLSMNFHLAEMGGNEDTVTRFRAAFLHFCGKRLQEAIQVVSTLFPSGAPSLAPHDPIDTCTVTLCEMLLDDPPVGDPRWSGTIGRPETTDTLGIKSKILLKNFLISKKTCLDIFFGFLSSVGLWSKLTSVVRGEDMLATASALFNCYEKIGFAISLNALQAEGPFRKPIDRAIKVVVAVRCQKDPLSQSRLAHVGFNDLFYKDVSRVHQFIPILISQTEEECNESQPENVSDVVSDSNKILLHCLTEMSSASTVDKYHIFRGALIQPLLETVGNQMEVLPWTIQSTVLAALRQMHELTIVCGYHKSSDTSQQSELLKQLQAISELILDGMRINVESIRATDRYASKLKTFEATRLELLKAHMNVGDAEGALMLAEKYLDFDVLVSVCYEQNDMVLLLHFFEKYAHMNFADYTFQWFVNQKKTRELLSIFSQGPAGAKLESFLNQYPQIQWHHQILNGNYFSAAKTLKALGEQEENCVDDKRFLLTMSKLNYFASGSPSAENTATALVDLKSQLRLIEYQNLLPDSILAVYNLKRETMRPLSCSELIDMFTCGHVSVDADPELCFMAWALSELMINSDLKREKRLMVVARAILRDPWDKWQTDHPMDVIEGSILYRFVLLAMEKGIDLEELYPVSEVSKLPELQALLENANAKFLLCACYEHLSAVFHEQHE